MINSPTPQRRLIVHAAHRSIGVSSGTAALAACDLRRMPTAKPHPATLRVALCRQTTVSGSRRSLDLLAEYLKRHLGADCARTPGSHGLSATDRQPAFDSQIVLAPCLTIVTSGGASRPNWQAICDETLGEAEDLDEWQAPCVEHAMAVRPVEAAADHPILRGVRPFVASRILCDEPRLDAADEVLLAGVRPGTMLPFAWARDGCAGRVFCGAMGHPDDFRTPSFLRLLGNAVRWTSCRAR